MRNWASQVAQQQRICLPMQEKQETWVRSLGWEDPLEEGMTTHSSIPAWRIPRDGGNWWATGHGVAESDPTEQASTRPWWRARWSPKRNNRWMKFIRVSTELQESGNSHSWASRCWEMWWESGRAPEGSEPPLQAKNSLSSCIYNISLSLMPMRCLLCLPTYRWDSEAP